VRVCMNMQICMQTRNLFPVKVFGLGHLCFDLTHRSEILMLCVESMVSDVFIENIKKMMSRYYGRHS
jgi:hypothetical protein